MELAHPEALWLLLVVAAAAVALALVWRRRLRVAAAWAARGLWDRLLPGYRFPRLLISTGLLAVALVGIVLTLARPRWGVGELPLERRGVDLVFVLDTSLSMATRDVAPQRLWVAQTLIRRLVGELPGSRVALVQAEGDGVVMMPLTTDVAVIDLLLDAVRPGSLPAPGTQLARALDRALPLFPEGGDRHRVLVLVSDGEDHGSALERAVGNLLDSGVVVHALGVGTPEGMPLELPGQRPAAAVEYKRDREGNIVVSRLIEETLVAISRETGGIYLRATSAAADLGQLTARIREMERPGEESERMGTREERFQWPATLAIVALGLHLLIAPFRPSSEEVS